MAGAEDIHSFVLLAGRIVERLLLIFDAIALAKYAFNGLFWVNSRSPEIRHGEVLVEVCVTGGFRRILSPTPVEDLAVRQQAGMNDDIRKIEHVCPSSLLLPYLD